MNSIETRQPRRWPWALLVLLILAAGVLGFAALHKFKPKPDVKPIVRQIPIVQTKTITKSTGGVPVTGNGLVQPRTQVVLSAEVAARVVSVNPNLVTGGTIKAGSELIRLDRSGFRASVSQTRADLSGARSALSLAEQSVKRTEELIAQGFLSKQTLDERVSTRDRAKATLNKTIAANRKQNISLSRTIIAAPFDGRVLKASVNAGDIVQPGRELARVFDTSALEVVVSLTDTDMALIDNPWGNQPNASPAGAVVRVEHGAKHYEWDAQVERVEAAIDSATRTFNVVVKLLEPTASGRAVDGSDRIGPPLLVGMYATVEIAGQDQGSYFLLPRDALRENSQIWTVDADGKIRMLDVDVLAELDDQVAIANKAPLTDNMKVITSDLKIVTDGMQVRVIGAPTPAKQSAQELKKAAAES